MRATSAKTRGDTTVLSWVLPAVVVFQAPSIAIAQISDSVADGMGNEFGPGLW